MHEIERNIIEGVKDVLNFQKGMTSASSAVRGTRILEKAVNSGYIHSYIRSPIPVEHNSEIIIPQDTVLSNDTEAVLNCALYPYLESIFNENNLILVNSETIAWIPVEVNKIKFDLKPDLFATHAAFYESVPEYNTSIQSLLDARNRLADPIQYGKPF